MTIYEVKTFTLQRVGAHEGSEPKLEPNDGAKSVWIPPIVDDRAHRILGITDTRTEIFSDNPSAATIQVLATTVLQDHLDRGYSAGDEDTSRQKHSWDGESWQDSGGFAYTYEIQYDPDLDDSLPPDTVYDPAAYGLLNGICDITYCVLVQGKPQA